MGKTTEESDNNTAETTRINNTGLKYLQYPQLDVTHLDNGGLIYLTRVITTARLQYGQTSIASSIRVNIEDSSKSRKKILQFLNGLGYFNFSDEKLGRVAILDSNNGYPKGIVFVLDTAGIKNTIRIKFSGDAEERDKLFSWLKDNFITEAPVLERAVLDNNRVSYRSKSLAFDRSNLANDAFYPWLNKPIYNYFEEYITSSATILLLYGPPGTGKSTFLRTLARYENTTTTIVYDTGLLEDTKIIDEFYNMSARENRFLIYEDIDVSLRDRDRGNRFMSSLLNATDGIDQSVGKKIVLSCNLETLNKVDHALLRSGRCFDTLEFQLLSAEQANIARKSIDLPEVNFSSRKYWSLAEALNSKSGSDKDQTEKFKIGFTAK